MQGTHTDGVDRDHDMTAVLAGMVADGRIADREDPRWTREFMRALHTAEVEVRLCEASDAAAPAPAGPDADLLMQMTICRSAVEYLAAAIATAEGLDPETRAGIERIDALYAEAHAAGQSNPTR